MRRAVLASAILLCCALLPPKVGRAADATNTNVINVNVTYSAFAVAWYTDQSVSAGIAFGTSCSNLDQQSSGQDQPSDGYVHLVEAGGSLNPSTTYYYKLDDNGTLYGDSNGQCYSVKTMPSSDQLATPDTVSGNVRYPGSTCDGSEAGLLVTLTVTQGSNPPSAPWAVMTGDTGAWNIVPGNIRNSSGDPIRPQPGDTLTITAAAAPSNEKKSTVSYQPPPTAPFDSGTICLPDVPPNVVGGTPATSTPTVTGTVPTATATLTGTVTPATSTTTPTGTITPGTNTPTSTTTLGTITPGTATPTATSTLTATPGGPTLTPTATSTAVPNVSLTAVPSSTNASIPTPIATSSSGSSGKPSPQKIQISVKLFPKAFHHGTRAKLNVHTDSFADVRLIVSYPGGGAREWMTGTSSLTGFWQAKWVISTKRKGRASAQLRVDSGSDHRYFTVRFVIR